MSTEYHINSFVDSGIGIAELMRSTDRILGQQDVTLAKPTEVWLDDSDEDEPVEMQSAMGVEEAIQQLLRWPALGAVQYVLQNVIIDVGFTPLGVNMIVVWIAFHGKMFHNHPTLLPHVISLVHHLHEGLEAVRTSFDWGLADNYEENEEAERLSAGIVVGTPWLDLLRQDLVTPEHLEWLNSQRGSQTTLERTPSGGLVWQRDAGPP